MQITGSIIMRKYIHCRDKKSDPRKMVKQWIPVVPPLLTCTPDPSHGNPCHKGQVSINCLALIPLTLVPTNPMQPGYTSQLDHTKAEATVKNLFGIRMVSKAVTSNLFGAAPFSIMIAFSVMAGTDGLSLCLLKPHWQSSHV